MLKGMEIEVRSHMSVVSPDMLEAIGRKIDEEKKSSIEEVKRQRLRKISKKKPKNPRQIAIASAGAEEPAKKI